MSNASPLSFQHFPGRAWHLGTGLVICAVTAPQGSPSRTRGKPWQPHLGTDLLQRRLEVQVQGLQELLDAGI